jgi:hypothetical protein
MNYFRIFAETSVYVYTDARHCYISYFKLSGSIKADNFTLKMLLRLENFGHQQFLKKLLDVNTLT